jgi:cysteine desulfurase/selenocysteine lyase
MTLYTKGSLSMVMAMAMTYSSSCYRPIEAFTPHPLQHSSSYSNTFETNQRYMSAEISETQTTSSNNDTQASVDNEEEEWWKNVKLPTADLAQSTRSDFPILSTTISSNEQKTQSPLLYFDSAATSQKPTHVTDTLTYYYHNLNSNVHRGAHSLSRAATAKYEEARDLITTFINAPSRNEVIYTSGATEALNLIASTYGRANIQEHDEILITELEHHSNIVPWQILAKEKGATVKYIPYDPKRGGLDLSNLDTLLTKQTKIVSLQHVSNVLGCIHPIDEITAKVRELAHPDVKIILDACQSIPHMKVNVQSLDIDFLAASGHKMCGPTGIGFLWGKEDILNSMPPYMGGGEMIDEVYMDHSTFAKSPARFEAGTPSIAQAIGLGAAIEYLTSEEHGVGGMDRVEAYEKELGEYFMKRISEVDGVKVLGPPLGEERGAIVSFVCDDVHPSDLSTFLDIEGVAVRAGHHCCQPLHRAAGISHSARASLYFYNTKEEIDVFIEKLRDTLALLGGGGGGGSSASDGEEGEDDDFVPFF